MLTCVSAGGCKAVLKMAASEDRIILVNSLQLKFRSVKCLNRSRSLKQLTIVYVRWRSQDYLHLRTPLGIYF